MRCSIITQGASNNTQLLQNTNISVANSTFHSVFILLYNLLTICNNNQVTKTLCIMSVQRSHLPKILFYLRILRLPDNGRISWPNIVNMMNTW
jgi:hypothetical protein